MCSTYVFFFKFAMLKKNKVLGNDVRDVVINVIRC